MNGNKALYYGGFVLIVSIVLSYVFWGADFIPSSVAGPIIGHLDDAIVIIMGIVALTRLKARTIGDKTMEGMGVGGYVIFGALIILGLWYIFYGVDLIPDKTPYIGFVDDIIVVLLLFAAAGRIRKTLYGKTQ